MMTSPVSSQEHLMILETEASALIGSFSDDSEDEDSERSSSMTSEEEEEASNDNDCDVERCLEDGREEKRIHWEVAPGKFGRRAESDDWSEEESEVMRRVFSELSGDARKMFSSRDEEIQLLALRLVRGYWQYEPRVETIASVIEEVTRWRLEFSVATILRAPLDCDPTGEFHRHLWPTWFLGKDRYGHPVVLDRLADLDWKRVFEIPKNDLLRLRIQALECLQREAARHSRSHSRIYKIVYIVDVSGATFSGLTSSKVMDFAKLYAKMSEKMYSDAAWTNFVVNAPSVVRYAWRLIERIIDEETRDIVRFVPTGNAGIVALSKEIPDAIIPQYLGGQGGNPEVKLADFMESDFAPPSPDTSVSAVDSKNIAALGSASTDPDEGLDDDNDDDKSEDSNNYILHSTWNLINSEPLNNDMSPRSVRRRDQDEKSIIEIDLPEECRNSIMSKTANRRHRSISLDTAPTRPQDRIITLVFIRLLTAIFRLFELLACLLVAAFFAILRYLQPRRCFHRRGFMTPSGFYYTQSYCHHQQDM